MKTPERWRTPGNSTYYIASLLHNSEAIMPVYMSSLLTLTDELGHNNVFISIYENDSNDKTPVMLQRLDAVSYTHLTLPTNREV